MGISPAAVVGHSLGEISAAYVGGRIGLRDALRLSLVRGAKMAQVGQSMAANGSLEAPQSGGVMVHFSVNREVVEDAILFARTELNVCDLDLPPPSLFVLMALLRKQSSNCNNKK